MTGGLFSPWIAKWTGTTWAVVNTTNLGGVSALAVYGTQLYAGGDFSALGGVSANNIAKWNGSVWSAAGSGVDNGVRALIPFNGQLYAGGLFLNAGGTTAHYLAKWNGASWSGIGTGTGLNDAVFCFAKNNLDLYVGGMFTSAGSSTTANHVAKLNGTTFAPLDTGMNDWVFGLGVFNSNLYAGGFFTQASGNAANYFAKWDLSTGIEEREQDENGISIFPNPATSAFTISSSNKMESIKVFNLLGEEILAAMPNNNQSTINVNQFPAGIYFVRIEDEKKNVINKKIVKQ